MLWKPHNMSIFWSNISVSYRDENVIDDRKKWYYCNVHFFIIRIKIAAAIRDTSVLKQNLNLCLKEEA